MSLAQEIEDLRSSLYDDEPRVDRLRDQLDVLCQKVARVASEHERLTFAVQSLAESTGKIVRIVDQLEKRDAKQ